MIFGCVVPVPLASDGFCRMRIAASRRFPSSTLQRLPLFCAMIGSMLMYPLAAIDSTTSARSAVSDKVSKSEHDLCVGRVFDAVFDKARVAVISVESEG